PVQRLKVDRVFVADIDKSPSGAAIAKAIVDLALGLDLSIVAEGIETEAEAEFFLNAGCPDMQGYHFARPMPATKFVNWFKAYEARRDQHTARKAASL
ncbi:MAG: EAL domain-containing protein, partial [Rhodospirillaceae bacterium]|nr:EAL domain-containing protein [Rhodospirillaceae bacterium]